MCRKSRCIAEANHARGAGALAALRKVIAEGAVKVPASAIVAALMGVVCFAGGLHAGGGRVCGDDSWAPQHAREARWLQMADPGLGGFRAGLFDPTQPGIRRNPVRSVYYVVESAPVSFESLNPGESIESHGAILIRVFSDRDWILKLAPVAPLNVEETGDVVPSERLEWRSQITGGYSSFHDGVQAVVGRGARTGAGGELVVLDLRLKPLDSDPAGHYQTSLRVTAEGF